MNLYNFSPVDGCQVHAIFIISLASKLRSNIPPVNSQFIYLKTGAMCMLSRLIVRSKIQVDFSTSLSQNQNPSQDGCHVHAFATHRRPNPSRLVRIIFSKPPVARGKRLAVQSHHADLGWSPPQQRVHTKIWSGWYQVIREPPGPLGHCKCSPDPKFQGHPTNS
jgi:hypothetical protein